MNNNILIENIKKRNLSKTTFGNHMYSDLWYVDNDNKICITFTPRGGCSISFKQYLDIAGLLQDGEDYDNFIHEYRVDFINKNINYLSIDELINKNYTFIKFIMNPYIRAVSIFRAQTSHNLSFRQYLKQFINSEISYFNDNDKYHFHTQYIQGEENIITKYIKINENEKYNIVLSNGKDYEIDVNRYSSVHHGTKTDYTEFCGDIPKNIVNEKLPKSYKYFYDDEIKEMVETIYKCDIEKYNFLFDI